MLPQENWQAGCKWDDTRLLLCMTNAWLLKTVSARCFIKNTERKYSTAKTLQGFSNEWGGGARDEPSERETKEITDPTEPLTDYDKQNHTKKDL